MCSRRRRPRSSSLIALAALLLTACAIYAQPGYTPEGIQAGKQLYSVNCTNCHGQNGDFVSGVHLFSGHFRHASTDDDLASIIEHGIRDTPMPPANLSDQQAHQIVAYLRSLAAAASHQPAAGQAVLAHGKMLFETSGCLMCHRIGDRGSRVGPDLTAIGARRQPGNIQQSIVDPNAEILAENRFVRAVTRDGKTITGRVLNEDTFSLQLIDSGENLVSLEKSDLRSYEYLKTSPMPSFRDKLSGKDLSDLVAYLDSLKGM